MIGVHSTGNVPDECVQEMIATIIPAVKQLDVQWSLMMVSRAKVAAARNQIVEESLKLGCTHWLSLDTDHLFPRDMVLKLVAADAPDVAAVSGLIHKRYFPFEQVVFKFSTGDAYELAVINSEHTGPVEVDGCAFGCTLVNLAACIRVELPLPWFQDTPRGRSDVNFLRACRGKGLRVLVDPRVQVGHLLDTQAVYPTNVEAMRAVFGPRNPV
jgi:hypothetical protein